MASCRAKLGMSHHRPLRYAAGYIGYTMAAIGRSRGWKKRPPPPLQSLIINKRTRLPGHGVDGFMAKAYRAATSDRQREAAIAGAYAAIFAYPYWDDVLSLLGVGGVPPTLDALTRKASRGRGGGEGPEHLALKQLVAGTPTLIGLRASLAPGTPEFRLASTDCVDVVFQEPGRKVAVEVKAWTSSEPDVARGIYQCVKYRALLEAQSSVSTSPYYVEVFLALGGHLTDVCRALSNALGITVIEGLAPRPGPPGE